MTGPFDTDPPVPSRPVEPVAAPPPADPVPVDPVPAEPPPAELPAAETVPVDPVPVDPVPVEPLPVEPPPVDPVPVAPAPVEPPPVEPVPVEPVPVEPVPVEPVPVEPASVEPVPVEPASVEPVPTDDRPAAPPPRQAGLLLLVLVGLLTAVMVAGVTFLGLRLQAESQTETARSEATVASRDAARLLFSYDHTTLEEDFAAGLSVTTGDFRDEYSRTTKDVVTELAEQYQAVVEATVVESAVVEGSPDEVTVLVFLNQATTSTQISGRQVDQSRVRMRLIEKEGRWLVAEVQAL